MAKNNRTQTYQVLSHQQEYDIVKKDLRRVLLLNAVYLILIVALYYTNQKSGYLDHWFAKFLHF